MHNIADQNLEKNLQDICNKTEIPTCEIEYALGVFINRLAGNNDIIEIHRLCETEPLFSRERFEAKLRLNELCLEAINKICAKTLNAAEKFNEILAVYKKYTTHGSPAEELALETMIILATEIEQLKCLVNKCPDTTSDRRKRIIQKIIALSGKS